MSESSLAGSTPVEPTLTPQGLAERWHCSVGWLANLRSAGLGPAYVKLGRKKVVYQATAIEAFEAAGRVEPIATTEAN